MDWKPVSDKHGAFILKAPSLTFQVSLVSSWWTCRSPAADFWLRDSALPSCDSGLTEWVCSFDQGLWQQKKPDTDCSQLTICELRSATDSPQKIRFLKRSKYFTTLYQLIQTKLHRWSQRECKSFKDFYKETHKHIPGVHSEKIKPTD